MMTGIPVKRMVQAETDILRRLHRAIQKYLEDPLVEEILKMNIKEGDVLVADLDADN